MGNPFNGMNSGAATGGNNPRFMQMINGLTQFGNQFQGNPIQKVQEMMDSGQMSQQQYNMLRGVAEQIARLLPH